MSDNGYFDMLLNHEWKSVKSPAGAWQWEPVNPDEKDMAPAAHDASKRVTTMMTTADMAMRMDPDYEKVSRHFRENPDEINRVLPMNPSFVFFQETPGGPYGCLGQPVTEMRSVATDKDVFPRAGLMFIEVRLPDFAAHGGLVQRPERFFAFDSAEVADVPAIPRSLSLQGLKRANGVVEKNRGASLIDLGDGPPEAAVASIVGAWRRAREGVG